MTILRTVVGPSAPDVCAASSSTASIARKAGVMSRKRIEVPNAKWHHTMPQ
jgi:hypothetical protein